MEKLGIISNLVYSLKRKLGWCPEPPTVKTKDIGRFALNEGILYSERPPISYILVLGVPSVVNFLIFSLSSFLVWGLFHQFNSLLIGIILLISGVIEYVTFIFKREVLLTNERLHVRFGFFKDDIAIDDVISIERIETPRILRWPYVELWGVSWEDGIKKRTKWYVFGGGRTYIKIRRKSGKAVCVGVRNPEEFMTRWKMLQSQLGDSVDGSQKVGDR